MPENPKITIRLPGELAEKLSEVADHHKVTRTTILLDLLASGLDDWQPAQQRPTLSDVVRLEGAIEVLRLELAEVIERVDRVERQATAQIRPTKSAPQRPAASDDSAQQSPIASGTGEQPRPTASDSPPIQKTLTRAGEALPTNTEAKPLTYAGKLTQKEVLAEMGIARRTARDRAERSGLNLADWLEANSQYRREGKYWVLGQQD